MFRRCREVKSKLRVKLRRRVATVGICYAGPTQAKVPADSEVV